MNRKLRLAVYAAAGTTPPVPGPSNNTVALLGDSRIFHVDGDAVPTGGWLHINGFCLWVRRYTNGQVQFNRAHNFGVGGYTTTQVVTTTLPLAAASDAASVLVMCGVNDFGGGVSQGNSLANIDTIVSTLLAAGKTVFFCDDSPAVESSSAYTQHNAIRDHIRAITDPGVYVIPSWDTIATVPDGNTPGSGMADTVHYGPDAASRVGQACADVMGPVLPAFDLFGRSGVLSGGEFTGTGGSTAGGVTGTVPDGWTVALEAGTGTVASSIVSSGGHTWLQVTMSNGQATSTGVNNDFRVAVYSGNLASGWVAGTDQLDMAAKCEIDNGLTAIKVVQMNSRTDNTDPLSGLATSNGVRAYDGAIINDNTNNMASTAQAFTLWFPHVLFPSAKTSFNQRFEIRGMRGSTASGVVRFALPQLRKYTGNLSDSIPAAVVQRAAPALGNNVATIDTTAFADTPTAGNLMTMAVGVRSNSNVTITTPSGWTAGPTALNSTHCRVALFYKVAGASESTSWTVGLSGSAGAIGVAGPYEWVGYAGGVESAVSNTGTGLAISPTITGSAATTDGNELVIAFHAQQGNQLTQGTSAGWNLIDDTAADGGDSNTRLGIHFAFKSLQANETPSNFVQLGGPPNYANLITAFKAG